MIDFEDTFGLSVAIDADQWAYTERRIIFLETILVQMFREQVNIQEWFDLKTLCDLRLIGLPLSRSGLAAHAKAREWKRQTVKRKGRKYHEYHYSSLPPAAFDDLISRIAYATRNMAGAKGNFVRIKSPVNAPIKYDKNASATPQWMLPLMRVLKHEKATTAKAVSRHIGRYMPDGTPTPDIGDIEAALGHLAIR